MMIQPEESYTVSICTKDRKCFFGDIENHKMVLNDPGRMITTVWNELAQRFSHIEMTEHIVMPNHIHGIIAIVGVPLVGTRNTVGDSPKRADTRPAPTAGLGDIVGAFKSITTHEYILGVRQQGWTPFSAAIYRVLRDLLKFFEFRHYTFAKKGSLFII